VTLAIELESRPRIRVPSRTGTSETANRTAIKFSQLLDTRKQKLGRKRRIFYFCETVSSDTDFTCHFIFERNRLAFKFIYWTNLMLKLCTAAPQGFVIEGSTSEINCWESRGILAVTILENKLDQLRWARSRRISILITILLTQW